MAVAQQSTTVNPPAHTISPVSPAPHLQQASPGFDPEHVINVHEANLAEYLNQPVQDILKRLGLPPLPAHAPPPGGPDGETPAGAENPVDPAHMIKPATDALGTLGTGQFNNADPTQMFQGIAQAFESAAEPLGQAVSQLGSVWQGAAGTAAGATTNAALADGAQVATQSTNLGQSLSTVTATVSQAETQLIAIINEFLAKLAAIGPSIIFPWGMAAAIQAATEAVTETTDVMTETQGVMGAQAAQVASVGAPVAMSAVPGLNLQSLAPMLQMGTSLMSPVMEVVGVATQAAQTGASSGASGAAGPEAAAAGTAALDKASLDKAAPAKPGGGIPGAAGGGVQPRLPATQLLPRTPSLPATAGEGGVAPSAAVRAEGAGGGAGPMAGGPMGSAGKAGAGARHNVASFLHTSNDQIVGDLGSAAPPVIGQADPTEQPDIDLRI